MPKREVFEYPSKHRDWACPSPTCKFTLRTLPTRYAPSHHCNPNARSTHHLLVPDPTPQ